MLEDIGKIITVSKIEFSSSFEIIKAFAFCSVITISLQLNSFSTTYPS